MTCPTEWQLSSQDSSLENTLREFGTPELLCSTKNTTLVEVSATMTLGERPLVRYLLTKFDRPTNKDSWSRIHWAAWRAFHGVPQRCEPSLHSIDIQCIEAQLQQLYQWVLSVPHRLRDTQRHHWLARVVPKHPCWEDDSPNANAGLR